MYSLPENIDWGGFLQRPIACLDSRRITSLHRGRSVLITGAGGSIGSALARVIHDAHPTVLVLLDCSEHNLYGIYRGLSDQATSVGIVPLLGSICDRYLLDEIFGLHKTEIVYHAAACKHVPLMERNPFAAVLNNTLGTARLAAAAKRRGVRRLVMASTDKAVNPRSIMGVSKRLAELVLLAMGDDATSMMAVRLGNVLGSEGSVVPLWMRQIGLGGPVTVTDPEATRYFVTMEETLVHLMTAADSALSGGALFLPEMGGPRSVLDLARYLITNHASEPVPIAFRTLRPGEKVTEDLVSPGEALSPETVDGLHLIMTPRLPLPQVRLALAELQVAIRTFDLGLLLETVKQMVPEYRPSALLQSQLSAAVVGR